MKKYLQKVKDVTLSFLSFDIQQVPRMKNARVDVLSKFAALWPTNLKKETYFEVLKASSSKSTSLSSRLMRNPAG